MEECNGFLCNALLHTPMMCGSCAESMKEPVLGGKSGSIGTKVAVQYDDGFPIRAVSAKVMI